MQAYPLDQQVPRGRRLARLEPEQVLQTIAEFYTVSPELFREKRGTDRSRHAAAFLARKLTQATLRDLAPYFVLSHPESLSNLARRAEASIVKSLKLRKEVTTLKQFLV